MKSTTKKRVKNLEETQPKVESDEEFCHRYLSMNPLRRHREKLETMKSNIAWTENMLEMTYRGETAWKTSDWIGFLAEQKEDLTKALTELPRLEKDERTVREYLKTLENNRNSKELEIGLINPSSEDRTCNSKLTLKK